MSRNIFFDTNIVLDIIDNNRPSAYLSDKLLDKILFQDMEIVISEDMFSTVFYLSKNKQKTLDFFNIILDDWNISNFSKEIMKDAIKLSLEKNLDLEDVLQCLCAKTNNCDILITNDKKFYDCDVKIMSTKEFLDEKEITL